jgi:peroxiredoxin
MTQRGQWLFVMVIVGILAGALIAGLTLSPTLQRVGVESKAPDFQAVDVATGDTVHLADFDGDVVLLNIWATWCPPCVREMPSMQRLYDSLGTDGLRVIAVSVDNGGIGVVREWTSEKAFTFDILHDKSAEIERIYQTSGVPESFVIDREGVIVKKLIGAAEWDHPTQVALMRRLLGTDAEDVDQQAP